ncbi:MAG: hypothetical protein ACE5IQ_09505 [Candidatus Methylomirabilales bacterium]
MMRIDDSPEEQEPERLPEKAREVGIRHMVLGFLVLLVLLFVLAWCSLPGR